MTGITPWKSGRFIRPQKIGFVSTRFAGTDGVSLESAKWAEVLAGDQHACFWYAGRLNRNRQVSYCVPEANFGHPENVWINERIWGVHARDPLVSRRIRDLADYLKFTLHDFVEKFHIDILIIENALSIPMHVPLGVAITQYLQENRIPAIAHHHDFYWERTRFSVNAVGDYLEMAFPPREKDLQHVVINQIAQEDLSWRKGVPSLLIPNVLDFSNPPPLVDAYASDIRQEIGLREGDVMILQPTRVVPRKGIEHAINLVQRLGHSKYKLIISHEAGDEGLDYRNMLMEWARSAHVDLRFVEARVGDIRQVDGEGRKIYTLWDLYRHADLVTYPSLYEGFGNAFLEAIYFRI
ncbi:MAG: glycosyltransferase family 4 protein, partial [Lentisphaerota bacterium]